MRYLPKGDAERRAMLDAIGAKSVEELFGSIPAKFRLAEPLPVPGPLAESEIVDYFRRRAGENSLGYASFLGAGVYRHLRSVVTDALLQRGEFLTSYTPYQAEISQGTLQWIFEFQTLVGQLTGQEVANASMYDGSTALAEAALMAERLTRRRRVLAARSLHPEYRQVLETYAQHAGLEIESFGYEVSGRADLDALRAAVDERTAAVVIQSPNFFGVLEEIPAAAEIAHAAGALLVATVAEAASLGIARPPAEADIVAMEGQSYGLPPSYGGPFAGVLATREKFVRQMPGRLAGETRDTQGRRGFCLTLATREQHIRREKATSNICTNQALCALAMTIHLCLLGRQGVRELAEQNLAKARYAREKLEAVPGVERVFAAPVFNEFVIRLPRSVRMVNAALLKEKIIGPLALGPFYPELTKCALVCVTEVTGREEIERLADSLARILDAQGAAKPDAALRGAAERSR
ncbi:MAG TPA: aminomethyl-transferring glycine dehydrogenase subunit GcvPA [Patescibacteria group bacterium]|nr:aminomethyl-transferring glycine dehydrogenase subunit GcvPA [Patescibacteria group bacterium]